MRWTLPSQLSPSAPPGVAWSLVSSRRTTRSHVRDRGPTPRGGATSARPLHRIADGHGHRVYVTQRAPVTADRQTNPHVLSLDITSSASVDTCMRELLQREGRIDALVNNAGYDLFGAVHETEWHEFMDQIDTNFLGAARMVKAVLPDMLAHRSGRIIYISSIGGELGLPMNAAYSASKFALEGYTESLRQELLPLGKSIDTNARQRASASLENYRVHHQSHQHRSIDQRRFFGLCHLSQHNRTTRVARSPIVL